jgi:hypothetical protein
MFNVNAIRKEEKRESLCTEMVTSPTGTVTLKSIYEGYVLKIL